MVPVPVSRRWEGREGRSPAGYGEGFLAPDAGALLGDWASASGRHYEPVEPSELGARLLPKFGCPARESLSTLGGLAAAGLSTFWSSDSVCNFGALSCPPHRPRTVKPHSRSRAAFNERGLSVSQRALANAIALRDRRKAKLRESGLPEPLMARILSAADRNITALRHMVARDRRNVAQDRICRARVVAIAPRSAPRNAPRRRGAGRPSARRVVRRGGDSGDPDEPDLEAALAERPTRKGGAR